MALTRAQSRQQLTDAKAEMDALDVQIATATIAYNQAKQAVIDLDQQRAPLMREMAMLVERHKRRFNEDA